MGEKTTISWTHHTFSPWWGCQRVSPGCEHCYAEAFDKRVGRADWGPRAPRRFFGDARWREPLKWDRKAAEAGERRRVFSASMADVMEDRADLIEHRLRLWELIRATQNLDWLILTKRPENLERMLPWRKDPWPNVWIGTTAENQKYADERIAELVKIEAVVRFVSVEPQLDWVDLRRWLEVDRPIDGGHWMRSGFRPEIDWVIVGGESGGKARRFRVEWAHFLVEQCQAAGIAPFVKQMGDKAFVEDARGDLVQLRGLRPMGGNIEGFPETLRIRDYPIARAA